MLNFTNFPKIFRPWQIVHFRYDKKYDSPREKLRRFNIFYSNVLSYEEEERKNPELDLDVTEFADRTDEELKTVGFGLVFEENSSFLSFLISIIMSKI